MKTVGSRKEKAITLHAQGELLKEGAMFNDNMQKIASGFRFPKGVYRYASQEEANLHWGKCLVDNLVFVNKARKNKP